MTQIPQAIAWTLIHFCWQAAAIAAVYRLLAAAVARRSSQMRYLIALSALLLMLGSAVISFAWELRSDSASTLIATPAVSLSASVPVDSRRAPGLAAIQHVPERLTLTALLPWIDGLWLIGVLVLSIRSLGGWWYLRRLRLASTIEAPVAVHSAFQRIAARLGLSRPITLRLSTAINSPMTMGTLRAIVLLPLSAITLLGPEELEVVLAHELAHVRRADFFWNILQTIVETLFFFHPAVWWLSTRIRHERELCSDDLALQVCPNPVVYARALVHLEEQRSRHLRFAMALDGHQSHATLVTRIARILGEPMTRIPNRRLRPFSLAAACAGLVVILLPVPHLLASLNPKPQSDPALAIAAAPVIAPAVAPVIAAEVATHMARPLPVPAVQAATPEPAPAGKLQSGEKAAPSAQPHSDYIDQMRAAGYDVDLDKLIALKIENVTPEYARAMANVGFGKPSADELIACKMQGVTPESIQEMKKQNLEVNSLQDAVSYRMFQVTPDFVAGMKAAGFDNLGSKQLLSMRVQGITPEYAQNIKKQFPTATADDVIKTHIFNIDAAFIADAEKHGFKNLTLEKLVALRISGLLDDESVRK